MKTKSKEGSGGNLADIIKEDEESNREEFQQYIQENKLLKEEIKDLKEQLPSHGKDLVNLNSLEKEKEIEKLKEQNEALINDNKIIKNNWKMKKEEGG